MEWATLRIFIVFGLTSQTFNVRRFQALHNNLQIAFHNNHNNQIYVALQ